MKKIILAFLITATVFLTLTFSLGTLSMKKGDEFQVAMVTDFNDVNDNSFNQACYEGGKEWSSKNNIKFNYYKPAGVSLAEVAPKHPKVKFIGIDISESDFPTDFVLPDNLAIYNYHEEIAGYLAGYSVVKEGFTRLGYLGGMAAAQVIRYGYGYIQGIDAAAQELETNIDVQYVYGGQFFGDSEISKYVDNWYKVNKTEIVFSCGGSIYTSVALAAKENNGYMIGVDTDQAPIIDRDYKEGICITSAMKGIKQTVIDKLNEYYFDHIWNQGMNYLGLVSSENPELNFVQLALDHWRMKNFTIDDYKSLLKDIIDEKKVISSDISDYPKISEYTKVNYRGSIK